MFPFQNQFHHPRSGTPVNLKFNKERLVLSFGISLPGKSTEEPLWDWIPFTEEEKLYGRTDYENQIDFISEEMGIKMREERTASYNEWQKQLIDYRLRNIHLNENINNI